MAKVLSADADGVILQFSDSETSFIRLHSDAFGMNYDDAIEDVVEFGFLKMGETNVLSPGVDVGSEDADNAMISVTVNHPEIGVFSGLTMKDHAFIQAMMNVSLREAITMVLYQRLGKGKPNELGKEVEGLGS